MLKTPIVTYPPSRNLLRFTSEEFDTCPTKNALVNAGQLAGWDGSGGFRCRGTQPSLRRLIKIRVSLPANTVATVRSALVPGLSPEALRWRSKIRRRSEERRVGK